MADMTTPNPTPDVRPAGVPWVAWARKAGLAAMSGGLAVLGVLTVAVTQGSDGGGAVTTPEWLQAAWVGFSTLAGAYGVYAVKNQTAPAPRRNP